MNIGATAPDESQVVFAREIHRSDKGPIREGFSSCSAGQCSLGAWA
jgi:hypothetical protein